MEEILNSIWFTAGRHLIGIVLIKNNVGEEKAYIGVGDGSDESIDEQIIADHGAKFPVNVAKQLI